MPAESIKSSDPPLGSEAKALPKKKPVVSSGRAALAKITLLDGSILDVSIDVRITNSNFTKYFNVNLNFPEKSKGKGSNQFHMCRFEHFRKGLFWFVIQYSCRSPCLVGFGQASNKIFQN